MKTALALVFAVISIHALRAQEQIAIGDQVFDLAHSESHKDGSLAEYIPAGETLDNWNTLVAVRLFNKLKSPKKYVNTMAAGYRKLLPDMEFAIMQKEDRNEWMIDYILYPRGETSGFVEWNFFKARKNPGGKGIVVYQFVIRKPYAGSLKEVFDSWDLGAYRQKMLPILLPSEFGAP